MDEDAKTTEISKKMTQPIMDLITNFFRSKVDDFSKDSDKPSSYEAQSIVNTYALKCSSVSGVAGLVPGPLGMLSIIPDIVMVLRLQTEMLAKLSVAYNKEKIVTKELVLFMLFQGVGAAGISFVAVKAGQVIVKRASTRIIQRMVAMMGGRILQRAVARTAARFLPIIGASAMAIWVGYMTRKIGNTAKDLLSKDIIIKGDADEDNILDAMDAVVGENIKQTNDISTLQEIKKFKALIKVAQADGYIHDYERKLFMDSINKSDVDQSIKNELISALSPDNEIKLVLPKFNTEDEKVTFLIQLIAIAKVDANFSQKEKDLIFDIGKKLDLDDDDIMALL
ncbi:MAG: TerB family tellurite resistance protein [Prolixibacteraceae bacterium]|nr:TerB family tellurite resistance protein [Prolixibacteraceae bacterium]